jgi:hypothetical protein
MRPRYVRLLTLRIMVGCTVLFTAIVGLQPNPAAGQSNAARAFGPDRCGPMDPAYVRTANATGGQVCPLSPTEAARAAALMAMSSGTETVLWKTGTLSPPGQAVIVPVDSTTTRVAFSFSFDRPGADIALTDPFGRAASVGTLAAETSMFNCVRVITVDRPPPGIWTARITAAGTFWFVVHAKSELALDDVAFVQEGGRPGHEGLFRIAGQPVTGRPALLRAHVTRDRLDTVAFDLVSMGGARIQTLDLRPVTPDDTEEEFLGETAWLPAVPFRVRVSGRDRNGIEYQRVSGPAFHPSTVELVGPGDTVALERGRRTAFKVSVRNLGATARFQLRGVGLIGVLPTDPQVVQLGAGETVEVTVLADVPVTAAERGFDIVVTAERIGAAADVNSAIVHAAFGTPR